MLQVSQWDRFFENPKHKLKLLEKTIIIIKKYAKKFACDCLDPCFIATSTPFLFGKSRYSQYNSRHVITKTVCDSNTHCNYENKFAIVSTRGKYDIDKGVVRSPIFFFLQENICWGYALEASHWDASNAYPQQMSSWKNDFFLYFFVCKWRVLSSVMFDLRAAFLVSLRRSFHSSKLKPRWKIVIWGHIEQ